MHPVGTNTAPEDIQYSFEKAREAVLLLRETHEAMTKQPKPSMRDWAATQVDVQQFWAEIQGL